jgi:DNA-binding CsgD family transcriptional regulator/tetratricopeptide (TPR) repeat protein
MKDARTRARRAYDARAWKDAYEAFSQASSEAPLDADDLQRLAWAALLSGHEQGSFDALEQLHQHCLDVGDPLRAARAAFWLGLRLVSRGDTSRAGGWLSRAQRLVDGVPHDCAEQGYMKLPIVFRSSATGDHAAALAAAAEAAAIGDRFGDLELSTLGRFFEGRTLIRLGRLADGMPLIDEAMLAVTSGRLLPHITGVIYCSVIATCQQTYAVARAREWTAALSDWCRDQPQLVPFAGACLIHRSEIMQLGGAWPEAFEQARLASAHLATTTVVEAGGAFYQEGELHRLRGELAEAEAAYVRARERGRDPQPGVALLRVAQGRVDVAVPAMRRVLAATSDRLQRARFLPAHVEILLAAGELAEARSAADELNAIAEGFGMETLSAIAWHASGAVTLAEGDALAAVEPLRRAHEVWQRVGAPYLAARLRVLVARAFRALGDEDGATLELDAAQKVFVQLGAEPDVTALDALRAPAPPSVGATAPTHGLSARELQVLLLVAAGKTNKVIAGELFLSEKTIDRHVSNIFNKLDVTSRAAATAWAYQHRLVG